MISARAPTFRPTLQQPSQPENLMVKSNTRQILADLERDGRETEGCATFMYSLIFTHLLIMDAVNS